MKNTKNNSVDSQRPNKYSFFIHNIRFFKLLFKTLMELVGHVAVRMLGSQLGEPGFKSSCCHFEALIIFVIPRCHSSLSCMNEYLATDREYRKKNIGRLQ